MKVIHGENWLTLEDFQDWELVEGSLLTGSQARVHCSTCRSAQLWCRIVAAHFLLAAQYPKARIKESLVAPVVKPSHEADPGEALLRDF